MTYREIFIETLHRHNLRWCQGCDSKSSHERGFVEYANKRTVHLKSEIATRSTLHRALHEVGHCVNNEKGLRRYQQEANAEKFATRTMWAYGISVPRKVSKRGAMYVARKKRHGDNIKHGGVR